MQIGSRYELADDVWTSFYLHGKGIVEVATTWLQSHTKTLLLRNAFLDFVNKLLLYLPAIRSMLYRCDHTVCRCGATVAESAQRAWASRFFPDTTVSQFFAIQLLDCASFDTIAIIGHSHVAGLLFTGRSKRIRSCSQPPGSIRVCQHAECCCRA